MEANYVFSETPVQTSIHNKTETIESILLLGNKIWKELKNNDKTNKNDEELYYNVYNKYKEFGTSFPLILRWMVQMNRYSEKAFKKFLIKYSNSSISSKKEFLILQADYIVYLYEENKHYDKKHVNNYREFIIKQLLEEEEEINKIDTELNDELSKIDYEKRKQLYDYLIK